MWDKFALVSSLSFLPCTIGGPDYLFSFPLSGRYRFRKWVHGHGFGPQNFLKSKKKKKRLSVIFSTFLAPRFYERQKRKVISQFFLENIRHFFKQNFMAMCCKNHKFLEANFSALEEVILLIFALIFWGGTGGTDRSACPGPPQFCRKCKKCPFWK